MCKCVCVNSDFILFLKTVISLVSINDSFQITSKYATSFSTHHAQAEFYTSLVAIIAIQKS